MSAQPLESKPQNLKSIELLIFAVIWAGIFSIPFFQNRVVNTFNWLKIFEEWIRMTAFLIIFVVNAYMLVPRFLFKKKYPTYIFSTLAIILAVITISIYLQLTLTPEEPLSMPPMTLGPGMPPMELGSNMPAPMGYRVPETPEQKSIYIVLAENLIIALLLAGASTGIKLISQWLSEESKRKDVEREQLKTELALLRHQVSPHFFMNTLNNIHALVDINTKSAKDAIIQLSTLMRYLLYETSPGRTSLKKEVEFIESYITLMKLRFSKKVSIRVEVPETIPDIQVPPMLFISFIENAFKHGVSYQAESFVLFKLYLTDNQIVCQIQNSKHKTSSEKNKKYSGIGLTNARKSMELLFGQNYSLDIDEDEKMYDVRFCIPIQPNQSLNSTFTN